MHEITLLQGLSLAALVFVLGIDFWLEALFLFRRINPCRWCSAAQPDYGGSDDHRHCMVYGR
ncbi:N-acetylgalactosamine-specific PTS system EIIC component 1 [Escherichia coli]|nr:N-acetylgalactosamine-specific PTS system EIIC component 1 [Escherichia coli]